MELKASRVVHVGPCDNGAGKYALAKKKMTFEFLRGLMHLRPRTNTIGWALSSSPMLSKSCCMKVGALTTQHVVKRVLGGCQITLRLCENPALHLCRPTAR